MFEKIPGQNRLKRNLTLALESRQIGHAYLFVGYKGGSQEKLAESFAKALLCEAPVSQRCCGICGSCRKFESGNLLDYIHVAPEEGSRNIKIKQIRELIVQMATRTYDGGLRICLIVGADLMTVEAQNALLKSLEEPDPGNVFLLTADNGEKILPTIRSRCQVFIMEKDDAIAEAADWEAEEEMCAMLGNLLRGNTFEIFPFSEKYGKEKEKSSTLINTLIRSTERVLLAEKTSYAPKNADPLMGLLMKHLRPGEAQQILEILFEFSKRMQYNVNLRLQWENTLLKINDVMI